MNNIEYDKEIKSLAAGLVEDAKSETDGNPFEYIRDNGLDHETIDGHQWVIYYSYNLDVIANSSNPEAVEEFGAESMTSALEQGGINQLHTLIAYCAMLADLNDELSDLESNYEAVEDAA